MSTKRKTARKSATIVTVARKQDASGMTSKDYVMQACAEHVKRVGKNGDRPDAEALHAKYASGRKLASVKAWISSFYAGGGSSGLSRYCKRESVSVLSVLKKLGTDNVAKKSARVALKDGGSLQYYMQHNLDGSRGGAIGKKRAGKKSAKRKTPRKSAKR